MFDELAWKRKINNSRTEKVYKVYVYTRVDHVGVTTLEYTLVSEKLQIE